MANPTQFKTIVTRGIEEFESYSNPWSYLCSACQYSPPMGGAKNLVSAFGRLFGDHELIVVFVFDLANEPVAAMPMIKRTRMGIATLELPNTQWGNWGELLLNPSLESDAVYDAIIAGVNQISHFGLRLNLINPDASRWKILMSRLEAKGHKVIDRHAYWIGMVEHESTWDGFRARLSKGLRKKLTKFRRLLNGHGKVSFEVNRHVDPTEVKGLLNRVFNVERRSWKKVNSTSMADQDMEAFYCEQSLGLAEQDALCVSFLKLDGQDVAFEFGMIANRVYHSFKIGYDERLKTCSPGHLLAEHVTHRFHLDGGCDLQDTVGPISEATARWSSSLKKVSNVRISGNIVGARIALKAAFAVKGWLCRRRECESVPKLGVRPVSEVPFAKSPPNPMVSG